MGCCFLCWPSVPNKEDKLIHLYPDLLRRTVDWAAVKSNASRMGASLVNAAVLALSLFCPSALTAASTSKSLDRYESSVYSFASDISGCIVPEHLRSGGAVPGGVSGKSLRQMFLVLQGFISSSLTIQP